MSVPIPKTSCGKIGEDARISGCEGPSHNGKYPLEQSNSELSLSNSLRTFVVELYQEESKWGW